MSSKTNALRVMDSLKINYKEYQFQTEIALSGVEVANIIKANPKQVFKTLVTAGKSKTNYVFLVPVELELDLKKAASFVNEKSIEMIKLKDLLGLTGYIHGGCSPIGMKKAFKTVIDNTALNFQTIIFSGGRIGLQVEMSLEELRKVIQFDLTSLS